MSNNGTEENKVPNWTPIKTASQGGIRYEIYACFGCKKICQGGFRLNVDPNECIDGRADIPFFHQNTFQKEEVCGE